MSFYHGTHRDEMVLHEGLCLTTSEDVAARYAGMNGTVYTVRLETASLNVVEVPGYDHDTNEAPADDDAYRAALAAEGADVLRYEDEDDTGRVHVCYRLVSDRALAAIVATEEI